MDGLSQPPRGKEGDWDCTDIHVLRARHRRGQHRGGVTMHCTCRRSAEFAPGPLIASDRTVTHLSYYVGLQMPMPPK
jgi:hypothetical protein